MIKADFDTAHFNTPINDKPGLSMDTFVVGLVVNVLQYSSCSLDLWLRSLRRFVKH